MEKLTVYTRIKGSMEHVWNCFNQSEHINNWNFASDDWHCPKSQIDLKVGGEFSHTMAAKDGSFAFDLTGYFTEIEPYHLLRYNLGGKEIEEPREVVVKFSSEDEFIYVEQSFTPENQNPLEMQQMGWQAILDNFKSYCEKTEK